MCSLDNVSNEVDRFEKIKNITMIAGKAERIQKYFCSLCGNYDVSARTRHLIKDHNVTANALDQRSTSLFSTIFLEVARKVTVPKMIKELDLK